MRTSMRIQAMKGLSAGLILGAITLSCVKSEESAKRPEQPAVVAAAGETADADARTVIHVDASTRNAVLTEMRTMLKAVQGIVAGAANQDAAAMRAAATSAGMKAASEASPTVEQQLGPDFVQLGMRTHVAFDSLAADLTQGKDRDVMLRRLAAVMGNCVGCHEQWRLAVQP